MDELLEELPTSAANAHEAFGHAWDVLDSFGRLGLRGSYLDKITIVNCSIGFRIRVYIN